MIDLVICNPDKSIVAKSKFEKLLKNIIIHRAEINYFLKFNWSGSKFGLFSRLNKPV